MSEPKPTHDTKRANPRQWTEDERDSAIAVSIVVTDYVRAIKAEGVPPGVAVIGLEMAIGRMIGQTYPDPEEREKAIATAMSNIRLGATAAARENVN